MIMGKNCIREVLRHDPSRLITVFTAAPSDTDLIPLLHSHKIQVKNRSPQELSQMTDSTSHQKFVAEVKEHTTPSLKEFLQNNTKEKSCILMLDSITDPHNLGAILRAAECFGVDAVIWSKNRGCNITPAVSKVSVGASELVPCINVSNLVDSIKKCQQAGYWAYAAALDSHACSLYTLEFPSKTLIIVGSEGKGVRNLTAQTVDGTITIPMKGSIDSLNVSQAVAVILAWSSSRFFTLF